MKRLFSVLIICIMVLSACGQADNEQSPSGELSGTLTIKCDTILKNMDKLSSEKSDIVPKDGIVLSDEVSFDEGENLLDILKNELKKQKMHIHFEEVTPNGTAYVKGIANIYAGDCGELSGWMIRVNGEDLTVGCSDYFPKNGDQIEWLYTCDMGNDL